MSSICNRKCFAIALLATTVFAGAPARADATQDTAPTSEAASQKQARSKLDLTGRKRVGLASFYARKFAGRKMADGTPMDPAADNAASKTLPLGTRARVTNLETGQSAVVTIQDRGPHVKGRIIDLSPATARRIGLSRKKGVARVAVTPITVPLPDGSIKRGAAFVE
ncbi:Endolytic peptidoglycan transglycosylase RlpA [Gammaproteobacteria bacterium]|nr:Endolytic peptidoglycan transglycosylase RlpA [Gammaproteobacteria bacterium]